MKHGEGPLRKVLTFRTDVATLLAVAGALLVVVTAVLWYATLPSGIFMGDDLSLTSSTRMYTHALGFGHELLSNFTVPFSNRYRPIWFFVMSLEVNVFGDHFGAYVAVNVLLTLVSAFQAALLIRRLSPRATVPALAVAFAIVVSRLALPAVMVAWGSLELLAVVLLLLAVNDTVKAYQQQRASLLMRAAFWYLLLIFTDERFIVVIVFMLTSVGMFPSTAESSRQRVVAGALSVGALALNFAIKTYVFHIHFLQGSGDIAISPNFAVTAMFMLSGAANLLGFNAGPDWFSGRDFRDAGPVAYVLGTAFALPIVIVWLRFVGDRAVRPNLLRTGVLTLCLFAPLLLSASVSSRQEFRYLLAPYIIFLIAAGAGAGRIRVSPRDLTIGAVWFAAAAFALEGFYRQFDDRLFFMHSMFMAKQAKALIIDSCDRCAERKIVILTHGARDIVDYTLLRQMFFEFYGFRGRRPVVYESDLHAAQAHHRLDEHTIVYDVRGDTIVEIGPADVSLLHDTEAARRPHVDFVVEFTRGRLSSEQRADTPTGRGAFLKHWPSAAGVMSTLTVLSGFRYRYDAIQIHRSDVLVTFVGMPYPLGDGDRTFIDAVDGRKRTRILSVDLLPPRAGSEIHWTRAAVPLGRFAGKTLSIEFGVESPTGDRTADWTAFALPRIIDSRNE